MKVNIKYEQREEGLIKKQTVYLASAKIELLPEEQAIVDAYPEVRDDIIHETSIKGAPVHYKFREYLNDHCLIRLSESKLSVKEEVTKFKKILSNIKENITILQDDSTEETFDV